MHLPFAVYVLDTETTGLESETHSIIELSIYRLNDDLQRTWCLKPINYEVITPEALRKNGHKMEDLKWQTPFGRETYREANKVLPEIEKFFLEDNETPEGRILVGQNVSFDLGFLRQMWMRENVNDAFPFGSRPKMIDTMQMALFLDLVRGKREQYYNLSSLAEKYGLKKFKAHRADTDTLATKDILLAQMEIAIQRIERK